MEEYHLFGHIVSQEPTSALYSDLLLRRRTLAGYWLEEAAAPYYVFSEAGFDVEISSPEGGTPPVDAGSQVRKGQVSAKRRNSSIYSRASLNYVEGCLSCTQTNL